MTYLKKIRWLDETLHEREDEWDDLCLSELNDHRPHWSCRFISRMIFRSLKKQKWCMVCEHDSLFDTWCKWRAMIRQIPSPSPAHLLRTQKRYIFFKKRKRVTKKKKNKRREETAEEAKASFWFGFKRSSAIFFKKMVQWLLAFQQASLLSSSWRRHLWWWWRWLVPLQWLQQR